MSWVAQVLPHSFFLPSLHHPSECINRSPVEIHRKDSTKAIINPGEFFFFSLIQPYTQPAFPFTSTKVERTHTMVRSPRDLQCGLDLFEPFWRPNPTSTCLWLIFFVFFQPPKAGSSSAKATPRTPKTAGKKAKEQEARKERAAEREKAKEQATAQEGGRMGSAAKGKGKAKGTKRKVST